MSSFSGGVLEGILVLFLTGVKDFSQLKSIENGCGTYPASSGYGGLSLEMWWLRVLNDHTSSSNVELRMTELCFSSPYLFVACSGITLVASVCGHF
jgi:hypothetical protein